MPRRSCASAAVAIAGVLTIGLMTDTLRAVFEAQVPGVLNSVAASAARTRDELISELARQPMFESARRYREASLPITIRIAARLPVDAAGVAPSRGAVGA